MTERTSRRWAALWLVAIGVVLAAGAWARMGASGEDFAVLLCWAAGGSLVAAVIGALVVRGFRRRSVRTQSTLIAAVAAVSTAAGVLVAAQAMFISTHDLGALLVVLSMSAAVGLGAAVQLGAEVDDGTRRVRELARRLGSSSEPFDAPLPSGSPQFDALAEEVADLPRRLEELRARADALERSRSELVAWVSHDLRSPLATIRAMAEALDDGVVADGETRDRYHHQIRRDAERLSRLVDDLFELSRINSGSLDVRRDRVPLAEVVCDVLEAAAHRAEVAGVRLVEDVDETVVVDVAVPELTRVLLNVIDNAIRHTPDGGAVLVRMATTDGLAVLAIEDECGGIPEPDLERVFDVAFRGDAARTPGDQRGGLGLAIAKGLVEACSGTIEVDNASGGCRFTVQLPLSA